MLFLLRRCSAGLLQLEKYALIFLAASVTGLILVNVTTRSLSMAIYWIDELAIYAMIWMVMIGASVTIRQRKGIAVTLAEAFVGDRINSLFRVLVDLLILLFAATLLVLCWLWYDPLAFAAAGFDAEAFSADSFNFIYQEPTNTIGVPKYLVWLVMPLTATSMLLHALANLFERAGGFSHPYREPNHPGPVDKQGQG
ncbi:TRAP transporter small permease [Pelagibius sp. Alg239-R121]|uniref:TRAP transporter small permease n=1 Tax=Pelagibius sp. Alg239-R121 TaxID=2993448 RepID=UPI0024A615B7|nr:TRAP transporter small permease [Pelagibius sp. Alg239-R121]